MANQPITAHLPTDLVEELDRFAGRLDRSRGWIVKRAVLDWLEREAARDRLTQEALDSADAGRLIAHDDVERWLDSLDTPEPEPVPRP